MECASVGPFRYWEPGDGTGLTSAQVHLLEAMVDEGVFTPRVLREHVAAINGDVVGGAGRAFSLRTIEWALLNHCKEYPHAIVKKEGDKTVLVDLYTEFTAVTSALHKDLVDPVRRVSKLRPHARVYFDLEEHDGAPPRVCWTTTQQLSFVRWCLRFDVFEYIKANYRKIREHQSAGSAKKQQHAGKRVREKSVPLSRVVRSSSSVKKTVSTS